MKNSSQPLQSPSEIRNKIKEDLSRDFLQPKPWRVMWFLPIMAIVVGSWLLMTQFDLAWYWCLALSLIVGNAYGSLGFLAHEVSHGSMGFSKKWRDIISGVGFSPFLVTADFWHRWHNVAHHGNTNMGDKDPDSFGMKKRYDRSPGQKKLLFLAPGSGTWYSYLFLFYSFALHSQAVLWLQTKHRKEFDGFNRKKAVRDMVLITVGWITLGVLMGAKAAFFGLVLPFFIGNFVIQSYILTNHFLRPQNDDNNPVDNSMSLKSLKIFDLMHFHFSHHVEHHMFPKMPSCNAPKLRKWFLENMPERYIYPEHSKALHYLYQAPKVYLDANTLIDINNQQVTWDIEELTDKLITDEQRQLRQKKADESAQAA